MSVRGTDDGQRAGAFSRHCHGCTVKSSPALTLTYQRISLGDNRNLSGGSSRHDVKVHAADCWMAKILETNILTK